ncbi:hypothetical protein C7434_3738 [Pantoea sp. PNA 14-12]|uniref:hypothetical protein n=1 Tax=Pantoea TaxID=53335 RepID=UPI0004982998|nr:hypothetical protein [Pantoea]MCS3401428.1 hypothetical protein [Pantoea sp. B566]PVY84061.1 hypothetical protein C7427_105275 [Pantoea ananatis]TDS67993.1 hypothetical protein C7434_3738 [Pantoea sp. PNA 14-12]
MAKGDQHDFYKRLKALLPAGWFADESPVMHGTLTACAKSLSWCYALYLYARAQTRLASASNGWLDLAACDFFGSSLIRREGMTDEQFRNQIRTNLLRERGTRQAIIQVLETLIGSRPDVFEPLRPEDTGAYGGPAIGYGAAGGYGSRFLPYQAFVVVRRPKGEGIPWVAGYHISSSGYSKASRGQYISRYMFTGGVTDANIYAAIAAVKMEGTLVWVKLM